MTNKREILTVRLPEDDLAWLDNLAENEGLNRASLLRMLVKQMRRSGVQMPRLQPATQPEGVSSAAALAA